VSQGICTPNTPVRGSELALENFLNHVKFQRIRPSLVSVFGPTVRVIAPPRCRYRSLVL
jgi:hypothetical protein